MTCRHVPGDPSCTSYLAHVEEAQRLLGLHNGRVGTSTTPDAENFEIIDCERVGLHLALRVRYPNCKTCSYEGEKVMVFLNASESMALKWRRIDPHFREENRNALPPREAPSPAARFPGSKEGWDDALAYARGKG